MSLFAVIKIHNNNCILTIDSSKIQLHNTVIDEINPITTFGACTYTQLYYTNNTIRICCDAYVIYLCTTHI